MKKMLLLLIVLLSFLTVQAQNKDITSSGKQKKFHIGISYSISRTWNDINALSMYSVWYNQDLGTVTFNKNELDSVNGLRTEKMLLQCLVAEGGMVFLDKSRWYIGGNILFGISRVRFETKIDLPDDNQKTVVSDFNDPVGGISMNIRFNFTKRWGLAVMPYCIYSWGKAKLIEDSILPNVQFFINNLSEKYVIGYNRLDLMATYKISRLIISAGPGFYYSFIKRTYDVDRVNPETRDEYHDDIKSSLHNIAFIDACLRADWTIIDPLTLSFEVAAGHDLFLKTGLCYNF